MRFTIETRKSMNEHETARQIVKRDPAPIMPGDGGAPPPDLKSERAARQGSPNRKAGFNKHDETTEAALDLQAEKLSRLFLVCRATAVTVATLAYRVCR